MLNNNDLENICLQVNSLARETGRFFLQEVNKVRSSDIEEKGLHDYVSYVDKTAEQKIVKALQDILPEAGFITEEGTNNTRHDHYNWIIDPLDGTTNFLHRIPLYSTSIALVEGHEPIIGVVHEPNLDECFYAWKGNHSQLNGKKIHVSEQSDMHNSLLATGFPYYDYGKLKPYMDLFMHFARNTAGLRRLGSAAVDLVYTACGRFEGFYEYGLHAWDVAAGAFIVKQAGGNVTDFKGGNDYLFSGELLASNGILHNEFLNSVKFHFGDGNNR